MNLKQLKSRINDSRDSFSYAWDTEPAFAEYNDEIVIVLIESNDKNYAFSLDDNKMGEGRTMNLGFFLTNLVLIKGDLGGANCSIEITTNYDGLYRTKFKGDNVWLEIWFSPIIVSDNGFANKLNKKINKFCSKYYSEKEIQKRDKAWNDFAQKHNLNSNEENDNEVSDSRRVSDGVDELEDYRRTIKSHYGSNKNMIMEYLDNQCLNWHILDYKDYRILCEENGIKPLPMGYQPRKTAASKAYEESALYTM